LRSDDIQSVTMIAQRGAEMRTSARRATSELTSRNRKQRKRSSQPPRNERNEDAVARMSHGAHAQQPRTAVRKEPRRMLRYLGANAVKSFAAERVLAETAQREVSVRKEEAEGGGRTV
jgi:hypothetical protein